MSKERDLLKIFVDFYNLDSLAMGEFVEIIHDAEKLLSEPEEIKIVVDNNAYRQGYKDGKAFAGRHGEISLRDHFAGLAMQIALASDARDIVNVAEWSYAWADAMMKERGKTNEC